MLCVVRFLSRDAANVMQPIRKLRRFDPVGAHLPLIFKTGVNTMARSARPHERRISFAGFILYNAAFGIALGLAVASLVVMFDVGGLRELLLATGEPMGPLLFFEANCAVTGAVLKLSHAIITLPTEPPAR